MRSVMPMKSGTAPAAIPGDMRQHASKGGTTEHAEHVSGTAAISEPAIEEAAK